jgi:hypothetical protein
MVRHLRRPYNGSWVGDIKMFRDLEHRHLMEFIDYQDSNEFRVAGVPTGKRN